MSDGRFADVTQAKDFLVADVTAEAQMQGVPLSDAERKMMYYSVLERTIADEVADQFPEYDPDYEQKISGLLRSSYDRDGADRPGIDAAIKKLKTGDHYLLIMAKQAMSSDTTDKGPTSAKEGLWLLLAGIGAAALFVTLAAYWQSWKEAFWHWWAK